MPAIQKPRAGEIISFDPRHAILAADVCYRAAQLVNTALAGILERDGLVYMAAHHTLFSEMPVVVQTHNSPEAVVNEALFHRYLIREHDALDTIKVLKRLGRWSQCREAFEVRFVAAKK